MHTLLLAMDQNVEKNLATDTEESRKNALHHFECNAYCWSNIMLTDNPRDPRAFKNNMESAPICFSLFFFSFPLSLNFFLFCLTENSFYTERFASQSLYRGYCSSDYLDSAKPLIISTCKAQRGTCFACPRRSHDTASVFVEWFDAI